MLKSKFYRRKKLHPIFLSKREKKMIKEYCEALGYDCSNETVQEIELPVITHNGRKGFIQRYKEGLRTVYNNKSESLTTALNFYKLRQMYDINSSTSSKVYSKRTFDVLLFGLIDLEYPSIKNESND